VSGILLILCGTHRGVSGSTCCDRGGPWFTATLIGEVRDDIEVRVCHTMKTLASISLRYSSIDSKTLTLTRVEANQQCGSVDISTDIITYSGESLSVIESGRNYIL